MHPVLFRIPMPGWELPFIGQLESIPVYSYGFMLGLSLVVGWYLSLGLARRDGLPREPMANNYVLTALAAIVASRLLYIVTNPSEFDSPADWFSFRAGGLVAYGGFLGGLLGSWLYLRWKRIPLLPWADVAVPSLAAGLAITRVGCYLFGCDYGKPLSADAPEWLKTLGRFPHWAEGTVPYGSGAPAWLEHVKSEGLDPQASHSLPVHPTQIYEALIGVTLLALLLLLRKRQRFRGQIFFVATFLYGLARWGIEILRDDPERGAYSLGLLPHTTYAVMLALFAIAYAIGPARIIEGRAVRLASQVLAFAPAVVVFVALRPEAFAAVEVVTVSTSQLIGVASALAVGVAYAFHDRAARLHPESAMALELPDRYRPGADERLDDDGDEPPSDRGSDDEDVPPVSTPDEGEAEGEPEAPPPAASRPARAKKKRRRRGAG